MKERKKHAEEKVSIGAYAKLIKYDDAVGYPSFLRSNSAFSKLPAALSFTLLALFSWDGIDGRLRGFGWLVGLASPAGYRWLPNQPTSILGLDSFFNMYVIFYGVGTEYIRNNPRRDSRTSRVLVFFFFFHKSNVPSPSKILDQPLPLYGVTRTELRSAT